MCKYVYCKGTIYTSGQVFISNGFCMKWEPNYPCIGTKDDYIEFDNFEEIIEVGDLVHYNNSPEGWYESVIGKAKNWVDTNVSFFRRNIDEIWKRVNNTFIKVCHKKDGNWVID